MTQFGHSDLDGMNRTLKVEDFESQGKLLLSALSSIILQGVPLSHEVTSCSFEDGFLDVVSSNDGVVTILNRESQQPTIIWEGQMI